MNRGRIALGLAGLMMSSVALAGVAHAAPATTAESRLAMCYTEDGRGRWVTVNADHVNVRTGWGTSYPVIGRQNRGDHLCIMAGHPDKRDPRVHWWAFDYHGRDGWIIDTYVTYGRH